MAPFTQWQVTVARHAGTVDARGLTRPGGTLPCWRRVGPVTVVAWRAQFPAPAAQGLPHGLGIMIIPAGAWPWGLGTPGRIIIGLSR